MGAARGGDTGQGRRGPHHGGRAAPRAYLHAHRASWFVDKWRGGSFERGAARRGGEGEGWQAAGESSVRGAPILSARRGLGRGHGRVMVSKEIDTKAAMAVGE